MQQRSPAPPRIVAPIRRFACRTDGILSKLPDRAGLTATRTRDIKRHFPNRTQIQVNAVIGFAVADFCEQNAGKLGS